MAKFHEDRVGWEKLYGAGDEDNLFYPVYHYFMPNSYKP